MTQTLGSEPAELLDQVLAKPMLYSWAGGFPPENKARRHQAQVYWTQHAVASKDRAGQSRVMTFVDMCSQIRDRAPLDLGSDLGVPAGCESDE